LELGVGDCVALLKAPLEFASKVCWPQELLDVLRCVVNP
jgi:hypothetical protein